MTTPGMMLDVPVVLAGIDEEELVALAIIVTGVIVFVLIHSVRRVLEGRARELTKREVAAYVAEGTISPEDAAKILQAGTAEAERKIADAVAWGTIKPEKAESLLRTLRSDSAKVSNGKAK